MMGNLSALEPRLPVVCPERLLFDMRNGTWLVETIRASGLLFRVNRPNTRLHLTNYKSKKGLQKGSHPHRTRLGFAKISSDIFLIAVAIGTGFFILAIILVLIATHNALQPLIALTRSVERRGPQDLRPVPSAVPIEVYPLIVALNRFIKRLDKSLKNAEEFIADAAHRIRTPMAMIQVNAEIALRTRLGFAKISSDIFLIAVAIGTGFFILAIILVLIATHNALQPLIALTRSVERRGPQDLRPVPSAVPIEVYPLIVALNRFIKRLDKSLKNAEEFIADAAHRIRTPMAMIQVNAEIALRTTRSGPGRKAIKEILIAAEETSRSAGQLLDHATIAFRTENMKTEFIEIDKLVQASVNQFAPIAEMKSINILFQPQDQPTQSTIDSIMIQSAIGNVLDNAIKYSPADSTIKVQVSQLDGWVQITVTDQGCGFGEVTPKSLTKRFARGSNVGNTLGSGLGLAIVLDVMKAHGGKNEFSENPEGVGSCFSVFLPL